MPQSQLTLSNDDLRAEIGSFLGYGRGSVFNEVAWSVPQTNDITSVLKSCLGFVYRPVPLRPGGAIHNWSFLRPFATLTIPADSYSAPLPEDFGGFEGPILVQGDSPNRYLPIEVTNIGLLEHQIAAYQVTTGPPRMAAERVLKETTPQRSNLSELVVWPMTDQEYTVRVDYYYQPDILSGTSRFPPGGSTHSELFKAAALAAAEIFKDNERGPMWAHFMERLAASIGEDRKRKGQRFSYNGDWSESDSIGGSRGARDYQRRYGWGRPLLLNGVEVE